MTEAEYLISVKVRIRANAGYDETNDVAMARAFRTALREIIMYIGENSEASSQGDSLKSQLSGFQTEMQNVTTWLNIYDTSAASQIQSLPAIGVSLQNFRGGHHHSRNCYE